MTQPAGDDLTAAGATGGRVRLQAVAVTAHTGPLPHPDLLAGYEQAYPGAAKIIFDDFLAQAAHRRDSETRALHSAIFRMNLGSIIAAVLGPLGLGGGLWLAHEGRSLAGLSSVIGTIGTLLAVFLYRGRKDS